MPAEELIFMKTEECQQDGVDIGNLTDKGRKAAKSGARGIRHCYPTWGKVIGIVHDGTASGKKMFKIIKSEIHHDPLGYSVEEFIIEWPKYSEDFQSVIKMIESLRSENENDPECDVLIIIADTRTLRALLKEYTNQHFQAENQYSLTAFDWLEGPDSKYAGVKFNSESSAHGVVSHRGIPYLAYKPFDERNEEINSTFF